MATSHHSDRSTARRFAALLAFVLGVSLSGLAFVTPAAAAAEATITGTTQGSQITVKVGAGPNQNVGASLFTATINGVNAVAFCIDFSTSLGSLPVDYDEVDFTATIPNAAARLNILKILTYYGPDGLSYPGSGTPFGPAGQQITGSGNDKAAAVQAAIWHFSDNAILQNTGQTSATEFANYQTILAALPGLADPTAPTVSLDIVEPATTSATAGQVVGPYTIATTAASVTLTPGSGVSITDAAGNPLAGPYVNGTQFWLKRATAGSPAPSVTASATAEVQAGRAFVYGPNPNARQKLILASTTTAQVTDSANASWVKPAKAKVTKSILGTAPAGGFEFTLTGPGLPPAGVTGTVSAHNGSATLSDALVLGGTYTMTETERAGWHQRAIGCASPATNVSASGRSVTFTVPAGAADQLVNCTFENRQIYSFQIKKVVSNPSGTWAAVGFDGDSETFTIAYSCTRTGQPTIAGTVTILAGGTGVVQGVPHGHTCAITEETALPVLIDGVAWNAPQLPNPVEVTHGGKVLTVTNSFTDTRTGFTVAKVLTNAAGSGIPDDQDFPITVTCTKGGSPDQVFNDTIATDDPWVSPLLPAGYSCAIVEGTLPSLPDGFSWGTPVVSPSPVIVGQHNSATVTNTVLDQRVRFSISKEIVDATGSGLAPGATFDITITCGEGDAAIELSGSISVATPYVSPLIPAGLECTVEEDGTGLPPLNDGFSWNLADPADFTTAPQSGVTLTNTVSDDRLAITVTKVLTNAAGSGIPDDQDFPITVTCTKGGSPDQVFNDTIATDDPWVSPLLPAGYSCAIVEGTLPSLPDGFSWGTPVVSPSPVIVGQHSSATVTNVLSDDRVNIGLIKAVTGDTTDADVPAGFEYVVDITCVGDDPGETITFEGITVVAGEPTTGIGPVPVGWTCTPVEDEGSLPTLAPGHVWLDPTEVGAEVTGDGTTVSVTNTVEDRRSAITIRKDVVEGSATEGTFSFDLLRVVGDATEVVAEGIEVEVGAEAVVLADELLAGTYRVVEDAASGWDLVGIECSVEGGGDEVVIDSDTAAATIACAATNVELGSITVIKATAPVDADIDFPVTLTGEGYEQGGTVNATGDPVVFDGLLPGSYTLTEGAVDGWDNGPIDCVVDGDDLETAAVDAGLVLEPGDDVVCTITNIERASIGITKQVEGDTVDTATILTPWTDDVDVLLECDDEQALNLTLEPGATAGTLVSSGRLDVAAGTSCTVTEVSSGSTSPLGVAITIDGVAIVEGTPSSAITLAAGDELTVAVVNTYTGTEVGGSQTPRPGDPTTVGGTTLPRTGSDANQLMLLAGLLLVLGGVLLLAGSDRDGRRSPVRIG